MFLWGDPRNVATAGSEETQRTPTAATRSASLCRPGVTSDEQGVVVPGIGSGSSGGAQAPMI